jgi:hypothetical protein
MLRDILQCYLGFWIPVENSLEQIRSPLMLWRKSPYQGILSRRSSVLLSFQVHIWPTHTQGSHIFCYGISDGEADRFNKRRWKCRRGNALSPASSSNGTHQ